MDKLSYPVLSPLRFGGRLHSPGDAAEMTAEEAATLPAGVLGEPGKIEAPAEAADRIAAILAYVPNFMVDDFTKGGALKAAALKRLAVRLGWEPGADDIIGALNAFRDRGTEDA